MASSHHTGNRASRCRCPFHRHSVVGAMEFRVLGQPLLIEHLVLLLKGFHSSLEMHFQPLAAADGEKFHALGNAAAFINAANNVGESLGAASAEINLGAVHAVVVGNIAGAESEFSYAVVDGGLLKGVRLLVLHKNGFDDSFHILAPELWALFMPLAECDFLGHANNLHILNRNNLVFHLFYLLVIVPYSCLILDIHATEEIAGDDVEGGGYAVGVAFSMIADSADEALTFHLHIDCRGHDDLNAAAEGMDVNLLILCNGRFAQVQANASAESIKPGTMEGLAMIDVLIAAIVHRATDALAVFTNWEWSLQPLVGVATVAVDD